MQTYRASLQVYWRLTHQIGSAPGQYLLCAVNQEGADGAEGGQLFCVAEPAAGVDLGRGGGVWEQAMGDVRKTCVAEHFFPFIGGKQMRGDGKFFAPLVAIRIVAIIVDQDPG